MVEFNGLGVASNIYAPVMKGTEKETKRSYNIATGTTAAVILGAAATSTAVYHYAKKDNSLLNKAVVPVNEKAGKAKQYLKGKLSGDKLEDNATRAKTFVTENSQKAKDFVLKYVNKAPKSVQVVTGAALLGLAAMHIYTKGKINGYFAAQPPSSGAAE